MTKHLPLLLLLSGVLLATAPTTIQAKDAKKEAAAPATTNDVVTLSKQEKGPAATSFSANDAAIYAANKGTLKKDDKVKFVWIIEDSKTVRPNFKAFESTAVAAGRADGTEFAHLDRPATGWPLGKWRLDIYVNDVKATSAKFTIGK